jgi:hypothetical protein
MDLPAQELFQQLSARPITGEHLEVLGKKAAADWGSGQYGTLSEAVVGIVKHAGLSPEQVRRVIEFANTDAFLKDFKKEGEHKVVDFGRGGPATASEVLQDLNDGGGGTVFDKGAEDYGLQPQDQKIEGLDDELFDLMKTSGPTEYPEENPFGDLVDLRDKLASAKETHNSQLSHLEVMYADLADQVYGQIKQASLEGTPLSDLLQAWQVVAPSSEHVKVAFQLFTPRLLREEVFHSAEEISESLTKTSSPRIVNEKHPIVVSFGEFCETLDKLAETRGICHELGTSLDEVTSLLKQGDGLGKAVGAVQRLSTSAGKAVGGALRPLSEHAAGAAEFAGKAAPTAALLIAANEIRRRAKHSATLHQVNSVANPLSSAYQQREWELAQRGGI